MVRQNIESLLLDDEDDDEAHLLEEGVDEVDEVVQGGFEIRSPLPQHNKNKIAKDKRY